MYYVCLAPPSRYLRRNDARDAAVSVRWSVTPRPRPGNVTVVRSRYVPVHRSAYVARVDCKFLRFTSPPFASIFFRFVFHAAGRRPPRRRSPPREPVQNGQRDAYSRIRVSRTRTPPPRTSYCFFF